MQAGNLSTTLYVIVDFRNQIDLFSKRFNRTRKIFCNCCGSEPVVCTVQTVPLVKLVQVDRKPKFQPLPPPHLNCNLNLDKCLINGIQRFSCFIGSVSIRSFQGYNHSYCFFFKLQFSLKNIFFYEYWTINFHNQVGFLSMP